MYAKNVTPYALYVYLDSLHAYPKGRLLALYTLSVWPIVYVFFFCEMILLLIHVKLLNGF